MSARSRAERRNRSVHSSLGHRLRRAAAWIVIGLVVLLSGPRQMVMAESAKAPKRKIYLTDPLTNAVQVFEAIFQDTTKLKFVTTIPGFNDPWDVAVDPVKGKFALVTQTDGTLHRIDTKTDTIAESFDLGKDLRGVTISQDGSLALVVDFKRKHLIVFDLLNEKVLEKIKLKKGPTDIFRSPAGDWAAINHFKKKFITAVDINELLAAAAGRPRRPSAVATKLFKVKNLPKDVFGMGILSAPRDDGEIFAEMYLPDTSGVGRVTRLVVGSGAKETINTGVPETVLTVFPHPYSSDQAGKCVVPALTLGTSPDSDTLQPAGDVGDKLPSRFTTRCVAEGLALLTARIFDFAGNASLGEKALRILAAFSIMCDGTRVRAGGRLSSDLERGLQEHQLHVGTPRIDTFANGLGMGLTFEDTFGSASMPEGAGLRRAGLQNPADGPPGCVVDEAQGTTPSGR